MGRPTRQQQGGWLVVRSSHRLRDR